MKRNILAYVAIGVAVLALGGVITWSLVDKAAQQAAYDAYDVNTVIEASDLNGEIADHVKGEADAPVVIYEYADFQCPGCSTMNPRLNKLIEEYDGQVALVYRNFLMSYHQNGRTAASAAEAAGLQGYWYDYMNKLFTNQAIWEYASQNERVAVFKDLFEQVTDGKGDLEKFEEDINSEAVKKKLKFDEKMANKIDAPGTPSLYLNGERIDFSNAEGEEGFMNLMREKVEARLKELGIKSKRK